jgi:hypothetical protein
MKRKRYSEEKIISILKEHEAGAAAADGFPEDEHPRQTSA